MIIAMIPIIVLLLAAIIIIVVLKNSEKKKADYDERQMLARFKAYRAALWVLVAYYFIEGIVEEVGLKWASPLVAAVIGICFALGIFVVCCIFTDAYFSANESPKSLIWLFSFLALTNAGNACLNYFWGDGFITDGVLNYHCLNIVVVLLYVAIFFSLYLKAAIDKKKREE